MPRARVIFVFAVIAVLVTACGDVSPSKTATKAATGLAPSTATQGAGTAPEQSKPQTPPGTLGANPEIEARFADQPIDQLIGQLITTKLDGQTLAPAELAALRSGKLGGVTLFGYNAASVKQLKRLTTSISVEGSHGSLLQAQPFVMADQEGGSTRAIALLPPAVSQPVMGRRSDPGATEAQAAAAALAMRAAGVNVNLAPVADVDSGPAHVMRDRVFANDPTNAATQVSAAVRGFQAGHHIAATAKHFPGLGAATKNTDMGVSRVHLSRAELLTDAAPFQAAIDAKVDFIMTSHAIYDGLDSTVPATLDPAIATELLRADMGFMGVVISDSMNATGLREGGRTTVPAACPRAIAAGVDELLLTGSLETARLCHRRVKAALADGTLTRVQVLTAVARVMALKQRLGLVAGAVPAAGSK
ncbi:MAG: hypothetical protein H7123_03155 [Thermoleophilia bacterium]|nr:hypothetical protein [Thermoleophilia bacterium]